MPDEPSLPSPGPEILNHLARHPDAQDTIDGILHLVDPRLVYSRVGAQMTAMVAQLVKEGFLEEKPSGDGHVFYRASAQYRATLQPRPAQDSVP